MKVKFRIEKYTTDPLWHAKLIWPISGVGRGVSQNCQMCSYETLFYCIFN